ncbi:MAG: HDOD domain-containing protein, partial [Planctomycetes bacterium]|nr:HDOD domain-containing protein [Planctomycetota bacterium]
ARQIPLLSSSSMRLMEMIGDKDHSLQDVAKIIETDPALTVKVFELVNSAAFNLREPACTVSNALPYIGEKLITGIAMSLCAPQVFNRPLFGYESKKGELWAHGLRTAIAANELAIIAKDNISQGVAYTAGILHDVGKSVLSKFLTDSSTQMLQKLEKGDVEDYLEAEETMVGANHCSIGGELAKHWNLAPPLQEVISHHHHPSSAQEQYRPLVYVVHLSDMIAMMGGSGTGTDSLGYTLDKNYTEYIPIDERGVEDIIFTVIIEFEKSCEALRMNKGQGEQ